MLTNKNKSLLDKIPHEHCLSKDDMLDDPCIIIFNFIAEILCYGNSIAIETGDSRWLCISSRNSQFRCREWIRSIHKPLIDTKAIFNFVVIKLGNPFYDGVVRWGDKVWLKIISGLGTPEWTDGSVIGVQIYEPPKVESVIKRCEEYKSVVVESSSSNNTAELVGIPRPSIIIYNL